MPDSFNLVIEPRVGSRRRRVCAGLVPGLVLLMTLAACWDRDVRFESTATYRAPLNGLILEGAAEGVVRAGRDLSDDYRGRFRLRPDDGSDPGIELVLSSKRPRECRVVGGHARLRWTPFSAGESLRKALEAAGIEAPVPEELDELADAMDGLVFGPKGTTLEGQTDVLEVVEVRADYLFR